jgi:hypothetical protein
MNLEALRRKRTKRLNVRMKNGYNGQRRVFFIFQRGTSKFHGDVDLWVQYMEYARSERSLGLVRKTLDRYATFFCLLSLDEDDGADECGWTVCYAYTRRE